MIRLSELIGRNTLDVSTASSHGKVTGIALAGDRIVSIGIDGDRIDAAAVRGFDGDVVTYDAGVVATGGPEIVLVDPRESRVLDLHGDQVGTLADLTITAEGVIDSIVLDVGRELRGSQLRAIGSYAVIVNDEGV